MLHCPKCTYPVETEWFACRRCGTALPPQLRDAAVEHVRASALPLQRPARPALTPPHPVASDTMLPNAPPARPTGPDTLLPQAGAPAAPYSGIDRAKAAAVVTINVVLARLRHRKPTQ